MITVKERLENNIDIITLKNDELEVEVTNYGCTILKVITNNKNGEKVDVVIGYKEVADYDKRDGTYLGALVGRVCNRIGKGTFTLNDETYNIAINNGPNSLHGGIEGFSYKVFDYEIKEDSVVFHRVSPDGEENFPGTLDFYATYALEGNTLKVTYNATTDKDTIINITNHSYFNLSGRPHDIGDHELCIHADQFACVDPDGLFSGEIRDVKGTPFDFNEPKIIGTLINEDYDQLIIGKGYDHPFIFNTDKDQAILYSEESGIELIVSTTYPQAQVYSANYLQKKVDKYGTMLDERYAICIETQNMPDSINKENPSRVILRKEDKFEETTTYTFKLR